MGKIAILGAGESGAGAAVLAKKQGFDVFVSDMSKINDKYKNLMDDHQIEWEEGHHTEENRGIKATKRRKNPKKNRTSETQTRERNGRTPTTNQRRINIQR